MRHIIRGESMRTIKFRAWDKKQERMFVPDGLKNPVNFTENVEHMQFTGQTDIEDNEIYEGDILRYELEPSERNFYDMESHGIGYVRWDDYTASWVVSVNEVETVPKTFFQNQTRNYEVVGNRYENPELMPEAA
jgi:uncharacterized phage protein (TIGR01671 family)